MSEDNSLVANISDSYDSIAKFFERTADVTFAVAERVLVVGAIQYAASRVPDGAPNKILITNISSLFGLILIMWVITKLWAIHARDVKVLFDFPYFTGVWSRRIFRFIVLIIVLYSAYYLNQLITEIINGGIESVTSAAT